MNLNKVHVACFYFHLCTINPRLGTPVVLGGGGLIHIKTLNMLPILIVDGCLHHLYADTMSSYIETTNSNALNSLWKNPIYCLHTTFLIGFYFQRRRPSVMRQLELVLFVYCWVCLFGGKQPRCTGCICHMQTLTNWHNNMYVYNPSQSIANMVRSVIQVCLSGIHVWLGSYIYLILDAVRGRYCTIRYSWNIMPVWNYFLFFVDLPCTDLFSFVSMLLCSCYMLGHC